jgi:hypothetical protein
MNSSDPRIQQAVRDILRHAVVLKIERQALEGAARAGGGSPCPPPPPGRDRASGRLSARPGEGFEEIGFFGNPISKFRAIKIISSDPERQRAVARLARKIVAAMHGP